MAIPGYEIPSDDGYRPNVAEFSKEDALAAALEYALCLEMDCTDCIKTATAWTRVHALVALCAME